VVSEIADKYNAANKATQTNNTRRGIKQTNPVNGKQGVYLDGVDDFYVGNSSLAPMGTSYTKVITFMPEGIESAATSYNLITSAASTVKHQLALLKFSATVLRFNDAAISTTIQYDTDILNAGSIMTITKSSDGTNHKLYCCGVLIKSSSTAFSNTDTGWLLGAFNNTTPSNFFKGYIHHVILYNKVLSDGGVSVGQTAGGEVYQIDEYERKALRQISGQTHVVADVLAQSNSVGKGVTKSADNTPYIGFEYIPSLRIFRDLRDSTGESYSKAVNGSMFPAMANRIYSQTGKRMVLLKTSKTGSTIDSNGAPDVDTHWGVGGTLLTNALTNIDKLLVDAGKVDWFLSNDGEGNMAYMNSTPSYTGAMFEAAYEDRVINQILPKAPTAKWCIIKTVTPRNTSTDVALYPTVSAAVQLAEQNIADRYANVFIETTPPTFTIAGGQLQSTDGLHWTTAAEESEGILVANIMIAN
jgi:hypothetical protein